MTAASRAPASAGPFGWWSVVRLGFVQASLGAVVVMTTSTLNRVMVVELALPALLPGLLVAFHYLVQVVRPRLGHGADVSGRHTAWMLGGVAVLSVGGLGAAVATAWMATSPVAGISLAVLAFALIGLGVGASGTSLLALLAKRVPDERRAASATIVWLMMIAGFVVTSGVAGQLLDPYTPQRLVAVVAGVSLAAFVVTALATFRIERHGEAGGGVAPETDAPPPAKPAFRAALASVWADRDARRFTWFVFVSMLAYSAQDLILEPFAGTVFGFTPGATTKLSSVQHGGVLLGMLAAAFAGARLRGHRLGSLRGWTVAGCVASAIALAGLVVAGLAGDAAAAWPLRANVFAMGVANGVFSIAAIGSMMRLAGGGQANGERREGRAHGCVGGRAGRRVRARRHRRHRRVGPRARARRPLGHGLRARLRVRERALPAGGVDGVPPRAVSVRRGCCCSVAPIPVEFRSPT